MTRIEPCRPGSQKCVSSLDDEGYPAMDPVPFECSPEDAAAAVRRVVRATPRTTVEVDEDGYLSMIVRTRLLRFKDRVELDVAADEGVIHFRSYSTLSWARDDLGANRDRMRELTAALRRELPAG